MARTRTEEFWELTILDADPPAGGLGSCAAADIDGDGHVEMVIGGGGALLWYRPATFERGVIAEGRFVVGLATEDVDGDGCLEIVSGMEDGGSQIAWFKSRGGIVGPWDRHMVDGACTGSPHDVLFADMDGDGRNELVAVAAYSDTPGLFIYKPGADLTAPWPRHTVQAGYFADGTSVADLDGDGRLEIISGPAWYHAPPGGAFSGLWERRVFAPNFREMCRTSCARVTGSARPDIVISEAEYLDGLLSVFENRLLEDPREPWAELRLADDLQYAHSLRAWRQGGRAHIFVAEMAAGGWVDFYNYDARLLHFSTSNGRKWDRQLIYRGCGTHEALPCDVDGDGQWEVVGKEWKFPKVHVFKPRHAPDPLARFRHRMLDRDKPYTATDIFACDVDGDGRQDVVCGGWWYRNSDWRRFEIPGVYQAHCAYDLDGDGRQEIIATRRRSDAEPGYASLCSDLCWVKPLDPVAGRWEEHSIGTGSGDWPHAALVAPLLPGGRPALVVGYHSASQNHFPELFEVPARPAEGPWPRRVLAEIPYGEEIVACDLEGGGRLDLVAGPWWLENRGDGTFEPRKLGEARSVARVRVTDLNGDGHLDVLYVVEDVDWGPAKVARFAPVAWLENPGDPRRVPWAVHVIDKVRSPHSLDVADLDGDGEPEVIVGEHDPFLPYRKRCRLFVYKKADPRGRAWTRHLVDGRFEHHDGTRVIELAPGRLGIISHGWQDTRYVHLWEPR
jgi:hypothetical protein